MNETNVSINDWIKANCDLDGIKNRWNRSIGDDIINAVYNRYIKTSYFNAMCSGKSIKEIIDLGHIVRDIIFHSLFTLTA